MKLLLDEHLSPAIAETARQLKPGLDILSIYHWKNGDFLNQPDELIIRACARERRVLVTFDVRTIPPVLTQLAIENVSHSGIIFGSTKSLPTNLFKRVASAIVRTVETTKGQSWTNRVAFLKG